MLAPGDTCAVASHRVEQVAQAYELWNAGDWETPMGLAAPGIEWVTPPEDPDGGVHRGVEAIQAFWRGWREAMGQLRFEVEAFHEHGDHVVAFVRRRGLGQASGIEIEDEMAQVFTFQGEQIVRVTEHFDRDEALRTAGIQA